MRVVALWRQLQNDDITDETEETNFTNGATGPTEMNGAAALPGPSRPMGPGSTDRRLGAGSTTSS
jgi:hypothetical protein